MRHFLYLIKIKWVRIKQGLALMILGQEKYVGLVKRKLFKRIRTAEHREPEEQMIKHFVSKGAMCIDIGAFYGEFTYLFSRQCGSKGRVLAIEPVLYNFQILNDLIAHFNLNNVTTIQTAIGSTSGIAVMDYPTALGVGQTAIARLITNGEGERVPVSTLDDLFEELHWNGLDFLKCDVEGAEMLVINGAERTIKAYWPVMLIEIAEKWATRYGYHAEDVFRRIEHMGYHSFYLFNKRLIPFSVICFTLSNIQFFLYS